jgi:hypothetical protein
MLGKEHHQAVQTRLHIKFISEFNVELQAYTGLASVVPIDKGAATDMPSSPCSSDGGIRLLEHWYEQNIMSLYDPSR